MSESTTVQLYRRMNEALTRIETERRRENTIIFEIQSRMTAMEIAMVELMGRQDRMIQLQTETLPEIPQPEAATISVVPGQPTPKE